MIILIKLLEFFVNLSDLLSKFKLQKIFFLLKKYVIILIVNAPWPSGKAMDSDSIIASSNLAGATINYDY